MKFFLSGLLVLTLASCGDDASAGSDASTGVDVTVPLPSDCSSGPLATPRPNCRPERLPTTGDPRADCVARINQFRAECQCLPALERWADGEACADMHAQYDSENPSPAHAGFRGNICSPGGNAQNECPGWPSTEASLSGCLQQMWDEGPGEDFQAHGHYLNMSNTRFGRVACGFYVNGNGDVWATQNFAP